MKTNKSLLILITTAILLSSPSTAQADWLIDRTGSLVPYPAILGESTEAVEATIEDKKRATERLNKEITAREKAKRMQETKVKEIRGSDQSLSVKEETRTTELKPGEKLLIENMEGKPTEVRGREGKILELKKDELTTRTDLPLKVKEGNAITVTLPNGNDKELVLPDIALQKLTEKGILVESTASGDNHYELTVNPNGQPVYRASAVVEKKLFGFIKMKTRENIEVAASNDEASGTSAGDIVGRVIDEQNPLKRLFARIAR